MVGSAPPCRVLRQSLMGRKRGVQFYFSSQDADVPDITPLWHRGEDLEVAVARLYAIKSDPEAGRAPRDAMLPEFDGWTAGYLDPTEST